MTHLLKQSKTSTIVDSNEIEQLATSIYHEHNSKSLDGETKWMPVNVAFDLARRLLDQTNASQLSTR
jgi:hypothetical protein